MSDDHLDRSMTDPVHAAPPREPPPARKSMLFCPHCDHASPVDGDWDCRHERAGLVYHCPSCEMAVTTRPDPHPTPVARWTVLSTNLVQAWT